MVESVNPRLDKNWKWTETRQRPMIHYTSKGDAIYAICLAWPGKVLKLESPVTTPQTQVRMLGCSQPLQWRPGDKGLVINLPEMSIADLPCRNAWVFKLTGLKAPCESR
jgi:alpha-L-fucosidase